MKTITVCSNWLKSYQSGDLSARRWMEKQGICMMSGLSFKRLCENKIRVTGVAR